MGIVLPSFAQLSNNHTYYYEKVASVSKDGKRTAAYGDGHYITVNNKQLYESNANGYSLRYGELKYINSNNGFPTYEGNSYLGRGLTYRFAADFSRLNIVLNDGTIAVYQRKNTPNNSNMRKYTSAPDTGSGYVDYNPSNSGIYNSGGSSENKKRNSNDDYYEYKCAHCNGTGRKEINRTKNMSNFGVGRVERVRCDECGKVYDRNGMVHKHVMCDKCNGKGKIRERL